MIRFTAAAILALALVGAGSAGGAPGPVFTVVTGASPGLPSAEVPNAPGSIALPLAFTAPPLVQETIAFPQLHALWHRAGAAYGIPWHVLAAINKIESNFGRNMGPSSAGAVGWMQFMPDTWIRWGTDATGDGLADPWNPEDAVFSAARYLAAAGAREDLYRGIFAYNHADWYVRDVLDLAAVYGTGGEVVTFSLDRLQVKLDQAREEVSRVNRKLVRAVRAARTARGVERALIRKANATGLVSDRLALERRAFQAGFRADRAGDVVRRRREALAAAKSALDEARAGAATAAIAPVSGALFGSAAFAEGYVFPVGGGPAQVSVGHDHHDYPAADIAAPMGAPLYALTVGVVEDAWPLGAGNCGIGFKLQAGDGRTWTYCHLSFLEPTVSPGVFLSAGAPVGLVGSTGHSTGPHLHLQTGPVLTHPQEEQWFQTFAGTAFTWQDEASHVHLPSAQFASAPIFEIVEKPVFEVVEPETAPADDVVEFTLSSQSS
jgi:murein DD-endopeptidase MepM/ murein hydrolase activator NlpD